MILFSSSFQLAFSGAIPEMRRFPATVDQNVVESQAVLKDYKDSSFSRGHLNPSSPRGRKKTENPPSL